MRAAPPRGRAYMNLKVMKRDLLDPLEVAFVGSNSLVECIGPMLRPILIVPLHFSNIQPTLAALLDARFSLNQLDHII